jgi:hypothetical protein
LRRPKQLGVSIDVPRNRVRGRPSQPSCLESLLCPKLGVRCLRRWGRCHAALVPSLIVASGNRIEIARGWSTFTATGATTPRRDTGAAVAVCARELGQLGAGWVTAPVQRLRWVPNWGHEWARNRPRHRSHIPGRGGRFPAPPHNSSTARRHPGRPDWSCSPSTTFRREGARLPRPRACRLTCSVVAPPNPL